MQGDAQRLGWKWVVAAHSPTGELFFLDPAHASIKRQVSLGKEAVLDNLLHWIHHWGKKNKIPKK